MALTGAVLLAAIFATAQTEDAFEKYSEGVKAYYAADYGAALTFYNQALQLQPGMVPALLNRGLVKMKLDSLPGAREDFARITTLDTNFVEAWYYLGKLKMDAKQYDSAYVFFQRALRIADTHAKSLKQTGIYFYYRKKYKEAVAAYSKIVESGTADDDVYYLRALALKQQDKYADAVSDHSVALERNPANTQALSERADCYLKMNELEKACADFRQLEKLGVADAPQNIARYCHP